MRCVVSAMDHCINLICSIAASTVHAFTSRLTPCLKHFSSSLSTKTTNFFYLMPILFNAYVLHCKFEYYSWFNSQLNILLFCFASWSLLLLFVCLFVFVVFRVVSIRMDMGDVCKRWIVQSYGVERGGLGNCSLYPLSVKESSFCRGQASVNEKFDP